MKCSRCETELGVLGEYTVCQTCGAICAEMKFVNCTPHDVHEFSSGTTFSRSGHVARCSVERQKDRLWNDIPIYRTSFGCVRGLPEPAERTVYIVSLLVKQACPGRTDLVCPGELVRDADGQPIGCNGFSI